MVKRCSGIFLSSYLTNPKPETLIFGGTGSPLLFKICCFIISFSQLFGPVIPPQNWRSWERRGEKLDYDNQAFHTLIINPFDNQTVSLP
jgi:hypothetical protein